MEHQVSGVLGFDRIPILSHYLGLPLFRSKKISYFSFLVDKLASWKANILSKSSKLVLIKSMALAIPIYAMQSTTVPKPIYLQLDARIRRF